MASSAGNLETVKILLKHDANKESVDSLGYKAYKAAMLYGDFRGATNEPFDQIMKLVKVK